MWTSVSPCSTVRADISAEETYVYLPDRAAPLSCPITVFAGVDDDQYADRDLHRWQECTRGACGVHRLPGDHFFLEDQRQGLTFVPISAQIELTLPLSAELKLTLSPKQHKLTRTCGPRCSR
jgi:surfactin synthase thioesterase subunit